jgi:hypothetical protein
MRVHRHGRIDNQHRGIASNHRDRCSQKLHSRIVGRSERSTRNSAVAGTRAGLSPLRVAALAELPKLPLVENRQGRPQARICGACDSAPSHRAPARARRHRSQAPRYRSQSWRKRLRDDVEVVANRLGHRGHRPGSASPIRPAGCGADRGAEHWPYLSSLAVSAPANLLLKGRNPSSFEIDGNR